MIPVTSLGRHCLCWHEVTVAVVACLSMDRGRLLSTKAIVDVCVVLPAASVSMTVDDASTPIPPLSVCRRERRDR